MRQPKHLWSGDWERESADASEELAALVELPRVVAPGPEPAPAPEVASEPAPARPTLRDRARPVLVAGRDRLRGLHLPRPAVAGALALGVAVLLALAAGAYIVGALLASSGSPGSTAAPGVPGSPGAPTATGPTGPMRWLGMEVETVNPGGVVVATVPPGSAGEQAGLDPGDIIVQVNNRTVNATGDITKAIAGLPAGQQVPLEASRGSTRYTTTVTLGAAPGHYP